MTHLSQFKKDKLSEEVRFQFSRSSGPGGQKVNKTESKAELYWSVHDTQVFKDEAVTRIEHKLSNRINKEGELVIHSDQFRSRERNKEACLQLFFDILAQALHVPKKRKKTKPSRSSVEKRIKEKKQHADKKKTRQKPNY